MMYDYPNLIDRDCDEPCEVLAGSPVDSWTDAEVTWGEQGSSQRCAAKATWAIFGRASRAVPSYVCDIHSKAWVENEVTEHAEPLKKVTEDDVQAAIASILRSAP